MTRHECRAWLYYTFFDSGYRVHDSMTSGRSARQHFSAATGGRGLATLAAAAAVIAGAIFTIPAGASERWFTVEIIVFHDLRDEALHAEHWPQEPGEPPLEGAVELTRRHEGDDAAAPHAFRLVSRSGLALGPVVTALRRSEWYRPLVHAAWRLPGLPLKAARPARVGMHLGVGDATGGRGGRGASVNGTVKVSLKRYLHVDVDLLYIRAATGEIAATEAVPTRFRLATGHRMRSGELRYIDHPLFGILMLITPFESA